MIWNYFGKPDDDLHHFLYSSMHLHKNILMFSQ